MLFYQRATVKYAASYCETVDRIAHERKYLGATQGFPLESTIEFVRAIEQQNLSQFYAIEDECVIGWCDVLPKPIEEMKHVGRLGMGILPQYRHQGIGSKLLDMAIDHAQQHNGIEKVELEVFKSNINAIRLYEKKGFVIEGEQVNARKLDGVYDNIILMGKMMTCKNE